MSVIGNIANSEAIKKLASKSGEVFNRVMESGNIPEGSIFDAAAKLGINNTEDLKAGIDLIKENPREAITSALDTLHEKGFIIGQPNAKRNTAATETATKANTANTPAETKAVPQNTEETEEVTNNEEAANNDAKPNGILEQTTKLLKGMGLDLSSSDIAEKLKECNNDTSKVVDLIKKQFGAANQGGSSLSLKS